MWNKGFAGWYFKHQRGRDMVALIPGCAAGGAFIQMISSAGSRSFSVSGFSANRDSVRAGNCLFTPYGCQVDLPDVHGEITYGKKTPLRSDIMGPFRYLPMECRHGVVSMAHSLCGSLTIDGVPHRFDGGIGYLEKDRGTSFPSSYQWLQCNAFPQPCSIMASIAHIPFCGGSFPGCICAIVYAGREYRLATYTGVRILVAEETHICLAQGGLFLEIAITPSQGSHPLRAPVGGQMTGTIRESVNAEIAVTLWERGERVFSLCSPYATYEYVPPRAPAPPER